MSNKKDIGRLPKQDLQIEEAVLGAILLYPRAVQTAITTLRPECFYSEANRLIYDSIFELWESSKPIDILTVTQQLRSTGNLENSGGAYHVSMITSKVSADDNLVYHITLLRQFWVSREIAKITTEGLEKSYEEEIESLDLLQKLMQKFERLNGYLSSLGKRDISDHAKELREQIVKAQESKGELVGIDTGFTTLNNKLGGFQKPDLIIVAARPGMGKTAMLVSSLRHQLKLGKRVAVFSLEMKGRQLLGRLVAQESGISFTDITRGKLRGDQVLAVDNYIAKFSTENLFIDDQARINPTEVKGKLLDFKPDIVYIDYIQLMSGTEKRYGNREAEVSDISRRLKEIAKELDIPVIALAQLSRAVETRGGNKVPKLADLRESGSIEQDADVVILLYRPEYYGIKKHNGNHLEEGESYFIVAKHRNGPDGKCKVRFDKETMLFKNFEEEPNIESGDAPF